MIINVDDVEGKMWGMSKRRFVAAGPASRNKDELFSNMRSLYYDWTQLLECGMEWNKRGSLNRPSPAFTGFPTKSDNHAVYDSWKRILLRLLCHARRRRDKK